MYKHHYYPFFLLLSTLYLLTFLAAASSPPPTPVVGSRTVIPHVESNKKVQLLGRFSVAQYNYGLRNSNATSTLHHAKPLSFSRVVEAEQQVVSGIEYYLKVAAKDVGKYSTTEKLFNAVVVVKPWLKSKELISFTPSP